MNFRVQIAIWMAILATLALVLQGIFGYVHFQHLTLNDLDADLKRHLVSLAENLVAGKSPSSILVIPEYPGTCARLVRENKATYEFNCPIPKNIKGFTTHPTSVNGWRVMLLKLPFSNVRLEGIVPLTVYSVALDQHTRMLTLTVIVFSGLIAIVAFFATKKALGPLQQLSQLIRGQKQEGHADENLKTVGVPKEIAELSLEIGNLFKRQKENWEKETEFVRHATHELNTPLTALSLQLEAYEKGWVKSDDLIITMSAQVNRMSRLCLTLLTFVSEERIERSCFDLAELARHVAFREAVEYRGPIECSVTGSYVLLEQALENLVLNAKKYANNAPVSIGIRVDGEKIQIQVTDHGPGMDKVVLGKATDLFYRVPNATSSGNGVGLNFVKRIMEAHGGELNLASIAPNGISATLVLPQSKDV